MRITSLCFDLQAGERLYLQAVYKHAARAARPAPPGEYVFTGEAAGPPSWTALDVPATWSCHTCDTSGRGVAAKRADASGTKPSPSRSATASRDGLAFSIQSRPSAEAIEIHFQLRNLTSERTFFVNRRMRHGWLGSDKDQEIGYVISDAYRRPVHDDGDLPVTRPNDFGALVPGEVIESVLIISPTTFNLAPGERLFVQAVYRHVDPPDGVVPDGLQAFAGELGPAAWIAVDIPASWNRPR